MAKRGPKGIKIDWEQFDKLCFIQCTLNEIAAWFDCASDTIERAVVREKGVKFAEYFSKKREKGLISLRRTQWQQAVEHKNTTLLIWLGKQYLGQTEKQVEGLDGKAIKTITLNYSEDALKKAVKEDEQS